MPACSCVFYLFFWEFDAWVLYLYHFWPSLLSIELSCILSHSGIHDLVFIFILFVCVYNLMDPPSIACMSVCLVLAIWDWMTYQGFTYGENWFSLSSHWLCVSLHLWVWPCEMSPIHISMSTGVIVWLLFWCFLGTAVMARRHSVTAAILVLWLVQSLLDVSWSWGIEIELCQLRLATPQSLILCILTHCGSP